MADSNAARRKANTTAVAKIVGPKANAAKDKETLSKMVTGKISQKQGEAIRGSLGTIAFPKGSVQVQRLNPSGKTMGQIAGEVANNIKTQSTDGGVLGQAHMGGHSDVGNSSILKTPVKPNISLKNK